MSNRFGPILKTCKVIVGVIAYILGIISLILPYKFRTKYINFVGIILFNLALGFKPATKFALFVTGRDEKGNIVKMVKK